VCTLKEVDVRMFGIGMQELLVILLICLLIFGAAKLPEIGKALGKTIKEFKKAMKEVDSDQEDKEEKKS
jgi:sec-independent protein translocase protein TatA